MLYPTSMLTCGQQKSRQKTQQQPNSLYLSANLGSTQVLPCELKYPHNTTNYVLEWQKGDMKTLVTKMDGYRGTFNKEESLKGRLSLVKKTSLQISHIQQSDNGWYKCDITYDSGTVNSTYIHLTVRSTY
ncbi:protein turtle [Plakobranchus ocellatus]|uniref:Protein turtle n=1 Tax=Plakobranchus ocellatus TaxID=259542 RepID=A0AAV4B0F1_9GAST|nr:protein turtle [Plakobranchus ocellatus]